MKNLTILIVLACMTMSGCQSQVVKKEDAGHTIDISKHGTTGICVVELSTNKTILSANEVKRMVPASLTKVFTSAAALELLGKDYCFKTDVFLTSHQTNCDLIVKGGGDPALGSDRFLQIQADVFFESILKGINEAGLRRINGNIVLDASYFNGPLYASKRLWEDMANYYGAPPSGLSYKENTFKLVLRSENEVGAPCKVVSVNPELDISFENHVVAGRSNRDSAYIYGVRGDKNWKIQGSIPAGRNAFTIKGALPDPAITLGYELKEFLQANGISVSGEIKLSDGKHSYNDYIKIASHRSPALESIIKVINKRSHNLFADHLLFEVGKQEIGVGNWDSGCNALHKFWSTKTDDFTGQFYDGSGLSPFNVFSCRDMVSALSYIHHSPMQEVFKQSLAISGVDGTFKRIWNSEGVKGSVIGKSGSMKGVLAYAGYFTSETGKVFAFCIMVNHFSEEFSAVRSEIEGIIESLIRNN